MWWASAGEAERVGGRGGQGGASSSTRVCVYHRAAWEGEGRREAHWAWAARAARWEG